MPFFCNVQSIDLNLQPWFNTKYHFTFKNYNNKVKLSTLKSNVAASAELHFYNGGFPVENF